MAEAQAASVASLKQVSADIAHDLKTPIQRVSVLLSRLEEAGLSGEQADIAARAREETAGIVKTFQSLLQIAQIEGGRIEERFSRFDLGDVVAGIVDVFEPTAEESGHKLNLVLDGPANVTGERQLLGQVTANLIENALRHAPPGSRIDVRVGGQPRSFLRVTDDGPGIPEEERANVLKRHYRLERSRTTEGSGLGLARVAAIADLHDAELELGDAAPGLSVTLTFPAT
jgi:signal transduction histidine kinase